MGRERETPAQIFWHIGIKKKVVQVVQIRGGGRGNLDKIQKNSYFFSGVKKFQKLSLKACF